MREASQQIWAPQERRVLRSGAAHYDVVAAPGTHVPAVDHEFLRAQIALSRVVVEVRRRADGSSQLALGCTLTSMTPGSGVTLKLTRRGSAAARNLR